MSEQQYVSGAKTVSLSAKTVKLQASVNLSGGSIQQVQDISVMS